MATPQLPEPVKLFSAILWRDREALQESILKLEERLGKVDFEGRDHVFEFTDYYEAEMGQGLLRRLVSFEPLVQPERLVEAKLASNDVEEVLRGAAGRRVNIDTGYLDLHKVVLASGKYGPQKIHLGMGVYADMILRYSKGLFHSFEWTFLDFRDGTYDKELLQIRSLYKSDLRPPG